jgi:hypothetical protein
MLRLCALILLQPAEAHEGQDLKRHGAMNALMLSVASTSVDLDAQIDN